MPRNDFTAAKTVEITISYDGKKVWVDVDGANCLRAYNVEQIVVKDQRQAATITRLI